MAFSHYTTPSNQPITTNMNLNITYYIVGDEEVSSWSKADYAIIEPEEPCQNMNEAALFGMMAADHIRKMRKVADVQHPDGACYYIEVYKAR